MDLECKYNAVRHPPHLLKLGTTLKASKLWHSFLEADKNQPDNLILSSLRFIHRRVKNQDLDQKNLNGGH